MIDKDTYVKLLRLADELMDRAITDGQKPSDDFMARIMYIAQVELIEKAYNYDKLKDKSYR